MASGPSHSRIVDPQECGILGPAEADETYFGGRRPTMPRAKLKQLKGSGPSGENGRGWR